MPDTKIITCFGCARSSDQSHPAWCDRRRQGTRWWEVADLIFDDSVILPAQDSVMINWQRKKGSLLFAYSGKAGDIVDVCRVPGYLFRGSCLTISDSLGGNGTKLHWFIVGGKNQFFPNENAWPLSSEFSNIQRRFDICQPALTISFRVEFVADCDWSARIDGIAVVDYSHEGDK